MEKILDKILNVVDDDAVSVDEVVETKKHETDDKTKMFKSTFMAISNKIPEVGEHYKCYNILVIHRIHMEFSIYYNCFAKILHILCFDQLNPKNIEA